MDRIRAFFPVGVGAFLLWLVMSLPHNAFAQSSPVIVVQPTNKTAQAGSTWSFNALAVGTSPLAYHWRKDGVDLNDDGRVSGATNSTLTIAGLQSSDNGSYSVVVSNAYGMATSAVATLKVGITLPGLRGATVAWADYDNDGKMDVLMAGVTASGTRFTRLYHNLGEMLFEEANVSLPQVAVASVAWGDYDNDGKLDFVISGEKYEGYQIAVTAVYHNDGNGTFTDINAGIEVQSNDDVVWIDFDNDGRLDIYLSLYGHFWRNLGNGTFALQPGGTSGAYPGRVDVGDFDNDGDQDMTLIAPLRFNGMPPSLVRNDGPAGFARYFLDSTAVYTYSYSYTFADYDNDGDLDVMLSDYYAQIPLRVYQNDGHGNFTLTNLNCRPFSALASKWGDYDNDGKLDCLTMEHGAEQDLIEVLHDEGTNWNHILWFSGVWDGNASFVDINNDGALDIFYTGAFSSSSSLVYSGFLINNIARSNTPPTAPWGLTHEIRNGNTITLRWMPATDAETPSPGLNYNLRVGTTPGGVEIMSPASDLATGRRQLLARGNAGSATFWILRDLPVGTYYWSVQAIDTAFAGSPFALFEDSFSITSTPPKIISQPVTQSVVLGSNALFSVTTTGTGPLSFQWQKDGVNLADGGNLAGATNAALLISGVQSNDAGGYGVIVSSPDPSITSVTSLVATLTILFPPTMATQPTNQTVLVGGTLSLSAQASGTTPLSYRWRKDGTNLIDGGTTSGATNTTLQITATQLGNSGDYTVVVTNVAGAVTSAVASVSILPLAITSQPASRTVPAGTNISLTVGAAGLTPIGYQWRFNQAVLPGRTNTSLLLTNVQAWTAGGYDAVVTNPYSVLTSAVATLTVLPAPPTLITQPVSRVVSVGQDVSFIVAAKGSEPMVCQWQKNGADLPGATAFTLTFSNLNSSFTGTYRAALSNAVGVAFTTNATLVVSPVLLWGANSKDGLEGVPMAIPATATNVAAIAAGLCSFPLPCLALRADGSLVGWGGIGAIPSTAVDIVAISSGGPGPFQADNNLALRADGKVVQWYGSSIPSLPAAVTNGHIVAVAAGAIHQLALRDDGTVIAWGSNSFGQTNVPPAATNVVAIAAGMAHSLALRADGTVVGWGLNTSGQATALSNAANVVAISAGGNQSLALLADGAAAGSIVTNVQLRTLYYGSPPADATNLLAISAGYAHTLAIRADRTVAAWGQTNNGVINVPAYASNVVALAAGGALSLALVSDPAAPPMPPRIGRPPLSRTVVAGQSVVFNALAVGGLPLSCQWYRDGAPVAGQTNAWLALANALPGDAGSYQLVAMNQFGSATSAVATVTVTIPQPQLKSFALAGSGFRFAFQSILGVLYVAEYRDSLVTGAWTELARRFGAGGLETVADPSAAGGRRFYRVRALYAPAPKMTGAAWSNNTVSFSVPTVDGAIYVVQYKTNLADPVWAELSRQPGTGAPIAVNDPNPPGPRRFYRIRVE